MRNLASIQKIKTLHPIENADRIEVARILGWKVVVKKGEFKEGDACVYCEIDSIMPDHEVFDFLRDSKGKIKRIKTARMRGQISQGIAFPVDILKHFTSWSDGVIADLKEGLDVTGTIGVKKYKPPPSRELGSGQGYGGVMLPRPSFVPMTDETRVQVLENILEQYRGTPGFITEKVDGSSCSVFYNRGKVGVCSRNKEWPSPYTWRSRQPYMTWVNFRNRVWRKWVNKLTMRKIIPRHVQVPDENAYWRAIRDTNVINELTALNYNLVVQGEIIGGNIQGNKYKIRNGYEFLCFNIYNIDKGRYLDYTDWRTISSLLGVKTVPVVAEDEPLAGGVDDWVERAIGESKVYPGIQREGIVWRPMKEIAVLRGGDKLHNNRLSFKVINPEFLLKYDG